MRQAAGREEDSVEKIVNDYLKDDIEDVECLRFVEITPMINLGLCNWDD